MEDENLAYNLVILTGREISEKYNFVLKWGIVQPLHRNDTHGLYIYCEVH
jgi:hypothetical protein